MHLAIGAAGINGIGVIGIDYDVAALTSTNRSPVAKGDLSVIATTGGACGAAVLLRTIDMIRKIVIYRHVIELRSRLVVPGAPAFATIGADHRALVAGNGHAIGSH